MVSVVVLEVFVVVFVVVYKSYCREHNIKFEEHEEFNSDVIKQADILYMTRVQRERFTDLMEYERVKDVYILRKSMLEGARDNMKILRATPTKIKVAIRHNTCDNPT